MDKREQIIEWFQAPYVEMNIGGLIAAMVLAAGGIFAYTKYNLFGEIAYILAGIMILVGGIIAGVMLNNYNKGKKRYEARISDAQLDTWLEEDFKDINKRAMFKIGIEKIDRVLDPICLTGPMLSEIAGTRTLSRKGKDDKLRYTPVHVNVLNFGQNQLFSYRCAYDFTTGYFLNENTDEYFYKDIVSISTNATSSYFNYSSEEKQKSPDYLEKLTLTTSGTSAIDIMLPETTIQEVRKILREKKSN